MVRQAAAGSCRVRWPGVVVKDRIAPVRAEVEQRRLRSGLAHIAVRHCAGSAGAGRCETLQQEKVVGAGGAAGRRRTAVDPNRALECPALQARAGAVIPVRHTERSRRWLSGQVELGARVGISHDCEEVGPIDRAVGLHREWVRRPANQQVLVLGRERQ